jgi:hypothetical protein
LPLRIAVAVGVLAVHDAHAVRTGEVKQGADRRDRRFGVGHAQAAARTDEVILHIDHDQCGPCGSDADLLVQVVLRDFDHAAHLGIIHPGRP